MINAINSIPMRCKANYALKHESKETNNTYSTIKNNANSERLQFFYYKPTFKGGNIYIGAYGPPPSYSEDQYSVFRDKVNAEKIELTGKDLSNYSFKKSSFVDAKLNNCELKNTSFKDSNMWGCDFTNIKTESTNFSRTNLCSADFKGADFGPDTDMSHANLIGADLRDTDLRNVNLSNAVYNKTTMLPNDIPEYLTRSMIFLTDGSDFSKDGEDSKISFKHTKLRYLRIDDAIFDSCTFSKADLKKWWVTDCSFRNVDFTKSYAKEMNAKNCDFSGAIMDRANFDKAEFTNVNMENANLCGAIFTFKSAENLNLKGARYDRYTVFNSNFSPEENGMIYDYHIS